MLSADRGVSSGQNVLMTSKINTQNHQTINDFLKKSLSLFLIQVPDISVADPILLTFYCTVTSKLLPPIRTECRYRM